MNSIKNNLESFFLKGLLIGLIFGLPVGAVGAMTVQRTLSHGVWAGMVTGIGCSVADCLYACVGAFGLTIISDFLLENQLVINIVGGSLVLVMGINMLIKTQKPVNIELKSIGVAKMFLSSFVVGITNPAAILSFLFAFSYFGIAGQMSTANGALLVGGVFAGTLIWWSLLSGLASIIKKKRGTKGFPKINKGFGVVLIAFAAVVFIKTVQL